MVDRPDATAHELERGRAAFGRRAWLEAFESLSRAAEESSLPAEDAERLATTAMMLGRDDDAVAALERAHHRRLERGEPVSAARDACWIGINLASRGATGPASGWLGRAERLLEDAPADCAERGFLLLPSVFRHEAAGDFATAAEIAATAAAIGERAGDADLVALARLVEGRMWIRIGRAQDGLRLLDEAMVTATTAAAMPFVVGIVYCGVILACQEVFDVARARQWTLALTRWVEEQPELVAFTGRCLVHRAEIMQLDGSWADALDEAGRAVRRLRETGNPAAGLAAYRQAELLRLLGDLAAAEQAYREASLLGWEPQPGLAQLRLAQGRRDAAVASVTRARLEVLEPLKRAALLPACVEIMLAAGQVDEARGACAELEELAERYESTMLQAMVAHARGAVELAAGDARAALASLRHALATWQELSAPYEIARTRELVGRACRGLGDDDAAALELEASLTLFERVGATADARRVRDGLAELAGGARDGLHGLSRRELEVLRLVAAGRSNREIASELVISEHTVARHLQNIFAKLGLSSRTAATAFAFEHGLV